MKKSAIFLLLAVIFYAFLHNSALSAPPERIGTLNVKINGIQYSADLFTEQNPYAFEVTAGNKNYEIQLLWNYVKSPADILTGTTELKASGGSIEVRYLDFLSSMNFFTHSGLLTVSSNDGKRITGEFSFNATGVEGPWSSLYNKSGSGSNTERSINDGTFEIVYAR